MRDIVERLRAASDKNTPLSIGEHWNLEDEAADELDRLRAENATLNSALATTSAGNARLIAENTILRQALKNHAEEAAKMLSRLDPMHLTPELDFIRPADMDKLGPE